MKIHQEEETDFDRFDDFVDKGSILISQVANTGIEVADHAIDKMHHPG